MYSHTRVHAFTTHSTYMCILFFFNDTATTEIYTLSLHDALPISCRTSPGGGEFLRRLRTERTHWWASQDCPPMRSEEHTSELQSQSNLVCRLLLEKKNTMTDDAIIQAKRTTWPFDDMDAVVYCNC